MFRLPTLARANDKKSLIDIVSQHRGPADSMSLDCGSTKIHPADCRRRFATDRILPPLPQRGRSRPYKHLLSSVLLFFPLLTNPLSRFPFSISENFLHPPKTFPPQNKLSG